MNKKMFKVNMLKNDDTQQSIAKFLGISQAAISARINGITEFRRDEINAIRNRWNLSDHDTVDIFFNETVSQKDTVENKKLEEKGA